MNHFAMLKCVTALMVSLLILCAFSAFAQTKQIKKRIIYVSLAEDGESLWQVTKNGAIAAARTRDFHLQLRNPPTGKLSDYLQLVESAITSKPDAIVLALPNPALMENVLLQASNANLPMIVINSDIRSSVPFPLVARIGEDSWQAGYDAGKEFEARDMNYVLCLNSKPLWTHYLRRCQGLADGLGAAVDMLNVASKNFKRDFIDYIDEKPALQAVITMTPEEAKLIDDLLQKKEKKEKKENNRKIGLASFGFSAHASRLIYNDRMLFVIDLQPFSQGYMAGLMLSLYFNENILLPSGTIRTAPHLITRKNLSKASRYAGTFR